MGIIYCRFCGIRIDRYHVVQLVHEVLSVREIELVRELCLEIRSEVDILERLVG